MTNTLKVRCDSCGENYWYKDGILCPKCGSNQRIIIATNDEGMQVCEKNIVILVMVFDLYDSVKIGGNISNSKNIEFVIDSECPGSIKQFLIKIVNPTPLDEKKALEQASAITNYLSLKVNRIVKHKLPIIRRITNGKMTNTINFTMGAILHRDFDLDANYLESKLLAKDLDLNKKLQVYNDGLKEIENNDFAGAIQSFYQCIEYTQLVTNEYKALRDGASHNKINNPEVIKELTRIGINIKLNEPLNENDPDNQLILSTKSCILKQIAWDYLDSQLSKLDT